MSKIEIVEFDYKPARFALFVGRPVDGWWDGQRVVKLAECRRPRIRYYRSRGVAEAQVSACRAALERGVLRNRAP